MNCQFLVLAFLLAGDLLSFSPVERTTLFILPAIPRFRAPGEPGNKRGSSVFPRPLLEKWLLFLDLREKPFFAFFCDI